MANITKRIDGRVQDSCRYQYWTSSENADDNTAIAQGDIFRIKHSLGKAAKYVRIETDSNCDLSIRLNPEVHAKGQVKAGGIFRAAGISPRLLDETILSTSMAAIPIGASTTKEFNSLAVVDIEIETWTLGNFSIFVS